MFESHENVWKCEESNGFYWRFRKRSSMEQFEHLIGIWRNGYVYLYDPGCHPRAHVVIDTSLWNVASTESLANLSTFLLGVFQEPNFWSKNERQVKYSSLGSKKPVAETEIGIIIQVVVSNSALPVWETKHTVTWLLQPRSSLYHLDAVWFTCSFQKRKKKRIQITSKHDGSSRGCDLQLWWIVVQGLTRALAHVVSRPIQIHVIDVNLPIKDDILNTQWNFDSNVIGFRGVSPHDRRVSYQEQRCLFTVWGCLVYSFSRRNKMIS